MGDDSPAQLEGENTLPADKTGLESKDVASIALPNSFFIKAMTAFNTAA